MEDEREVAQEGDLAVGRWFNDPTWYWGILTHDEEELGFMNQYGWCSTKWAFELYIIKTKAELTAMVSEKLGIKLTGGR